VRVLRHVDVGSMPTEAGLQRDAGHYPSRFALDMVK